MKTRRRLAAFFLLFVFCAHPPLGANPVGGVVRSGAVTFQQSPGRLTIHQTSRRAVINWSDFSIARGEITRFVQPGRHASVLNRVVDPNPSRIYGTLQANGNVYLINQYGIMVGPGGQINTRTFVASTLELNERNFARGAGLRFSGDSTAPVQNHGTIEAGAGGSAYLIGHTVENSGTIRAAGGHAGLAAGHDVVLRERGEERVSVRVTGRDFPRAAVGVDNSGLIEAASAELKAAGGNIYALAINTRGLVRADSVVRENGRVFLRSSGGNIQNSGAISARNANGGGQVVVDAGQSGDHDATVINSGTVDARGTTSGARGGRVAITGDRVAVTSGGGIDVSGPAGGGEVLVGGDYQGANPAVRNARQTTVESGATIRADATEAGRGGKVIVWSDEATRANGTISANGGPNGGNGGFVETSGKNYIEAGAQVSARAPAGRSGTWLLDPYDVEIRDINPPEPANGSFDGGNPNLFAPTGDSSVADRQTIQNSLNNDTSVIIQTSGGGSQAGNITVADSITKSAGATATLTLQADGSIFINNTISATVGTLNLSLNAGSGVAINAPIDLGSLGDMTILAGTVNATAGFAILGPDTRVRTLNVTAPGGISDNGPLTVTEVAALNSSVAGDITLDDGGQVGELRLIANNVSLRNVSRPSDSATVIGDSAIAGHLGVRNSRGDIKSASGSAVTVDGVVDLDAAGHDISFDFDAVLGPVTFVARNASITSDGPIDLGASSSSGDLVVQANGSISQSGALDVAGASTFRTDSASGDIVLDQANLLQGDVTVVGAGMGNTLRDLTLRNDHASATLAALPSFARDLSLRFDQSDLALPSGTLNLTGNAALRAGGSIRQAGGSALTMSGAGTVASLDAGGAGPLGNVSLDNANNDFTTVSVLQGNDVTLRDVNGLNFEASTVSGNLTVSAGGNITQSGAISAGAAGQLATFSATGGDIRLSETLNDFYEVQITMGRSVDIRDANNLNLGPVQASESVAVTVVEALTVNGDVTAGGAVNLAADGALALNANVTGNGVALTGTGVTQTQGTVDAGTGRLDVDGGGNPVTLGGTLQTANNSMATGSEALRIHNASAITLNGTLTAQSGKVAVSGIGALDINGNVTGKGVTLTGQGVTQKAGTTVDALAGDLLVDARNGNVTLAGTMKTESSSGSALILRNAASLRLKGTLMAENGTVALGDSMGPISGDVDEEAGAIIKTHSFTARVAGSLNLGGDDGPGSASAKSTLQPQNRIDGLGDVTMTGGDFYLFNAQDLAVNGAIIAGGRTVTLRTIGTLSLASGATVEADTAFISVEKSRGVVGTIRNQNLNVFAKVNKLAIFSFSAQNNSGPTPLSDPNDFAGDIDADQVQPGGPFTYENPPPRLEETLARTKRLLVYEVPENPQVPDELTKYFIDTIKLQNLKDVQLADFGYKFFCEPGNLCLSAYKLYDHEQSEGKKAGLAAPRRMKYPLPAVDKLPFD